MLVKSAVMSCEVVLSQCPSTGGGESHCRSWPDGSGSVTAPPGGQGCATCLDSQSLGGGRDVPTRQISK